jgi:hypothetical protein
MQENNILKIITPKQRRAQLKSDFLKRTAKLKKRLTHNWKLLFIHDHPEYKKHAQLLSDVMACRSLDVLTLERIEKWAKTLIK